MAIFEDLGNVIRERFKVQIADVHSLITQYDNQVLDTPSNVMWARLEIDDDETEQVDFGSSSKRYRTKGIAVVKLFQPLGEGDKDIREMADFILSEFRTVTDTGVVFVTPRKVTVGRRDDFWQVNVIIPFYYDVVEVP